jgi:hypothetical protein
MTPGDRPIAPLNAWFQRRLGRRLSWQRANNLTTSMATARASVEPIG